MVCQKPEKAPTAKPPVADIDPTLGLIGRRVKLKDGREGTIQYAASSDGLERFEVKLDNGDTVRLRGPNTTKPSPPRPAAAVSSATLPNSSHHPHQSSFDICAVGRLLEPGARLQQQRRRQ